MHRDLAADTARTGQIVDDIDAALARGRHCLVLTQRTDHLERLAQALAARGHDPVILRGGMDAKARAVAHARPAADGNLTGTNPQVRTQPVAPG